MTMAANLQLYTTVMVATVVPIGLLLLLRRRNHQRTFHIATASFLRYCRWVGWLSHGKFPPTPLGPKQQIGFCRFAFKIPYPAPVL